MAEVNARLFEVSSKKLLSEMSPYEDNFFKDCFNLPISITTEQVFKAIEQADAFEDARNTKPAHIMQNQVRKIAYRMINAEEFSNQPVFIDYREINGQIHWQPQTLDDAALLAARLLGKNKELNLDVAILTAVSEKLNQDNVEDAALDILGLKTKDYYQTTEIIVQDTRGEEFSFDWSFSKNDKYQQWNDRAFLKEQLQTDKSFKEISLYTDKAIWSDSSFLIEMLEINTNLFNATQNGEHLIARENLFNIEMFEVLQNHHNEALLDYWWSHFLPEFKKSTAASYLEDVYTGDGNKKKEDKKLKAKEEDKPAQPEHVEQLAQYLYRHYFDQTKAGVRFMEKNNYRNWLYYMSEEVRSNPVFIDTLYDKAKTANWTMDLYDYLPEKHWVSDENKMRYLQQKNGYMNSRFRDNHYSFLKNLAGTKESLMQCAKQWKENVFELYRYASATLQKDTEVIDAMFAINPHFYRVLPEKLKKNWNYARQYFNADNVAVREIPLETLFAQKDKTVIEKAVGLDKKLLNELKCPKHWREDEALMLSVASYLPELRYAMPTIWKKFSSDIEVCKKLVSASMYNYIKLTPEARQSDELINMVIAQGSYFNVENTKTKELQDSIPAHKWVNKQFCFNALHKNYLWAEKIPQPYWQNPAFVTELCRRVDTKHLQEKVDMKVFNFAPEQVKSFIANYDLKNNFSDLISKAILQSKLEQHLLSPQPQATFKVENNSENNVKAKVEMKPEASHVASPVLPVSSTPESLSDFLEDEVTPALTPETVTHDTPLKI